MIWTIRFIASLILQREAMGFGDVTLMAMIGAFLGWQPMVIVFFLSPFAGALVGLVKWILIRDNVIPYGPFLCLSTLLVLVFWGPLWEYCSRMFEIHWLVPSALIACVPVLVLLLFDRPHAATANLSENEPKPKPTRQCCPNWSLVLGHWSFTHAIFPHGPTL